MNNLFFKARLKLTLITLFIIGFITITTKILNDSILYQVILFSFFFIYYLITNRDDLKTFVEFTIFLVTVIILLHILFFIVKVFFYSWKDAKDFYLLRWKSITLRFFIIPNIFAFVNILIGKINFIDIVLLSKNSEKTKIVYVLLIAGLHVMERLRIHYEYHPLNSKTKGIKGILHYLAVPLTLFFGITKGFEERYNLLLVRQSILE